MASKALAYLSTTLTQGSNDAFVQAQIQTALAGLTKTAYRLREIAYEFTGGFGTGGATSQYELCLTRKSQAAMPNLTDKSVIWKWKRNVQLATSGMVTVDTGFRVPFSEDDGPLLVEDPLFVQLDSASTGVTNVMIIRLGYEVVTISEVDRLTLIANSLS